MNKKIAGIFIFIFIFASIGVVLAASFSGNSAGYTGVRSQPRPSYTTYYSNEQINTYWPILGDKETCKNRQDILLSVSPAGCQPSVVRSDLLAEQNVPVFCQIDSLKINPLIDINQIKNIRFSGEYPPEVVGAGFHPSRAALRTRDKLLGSPLLNNIGYVVVVLKRQEVESALPDMIEVNLSAQIDYIAGNAFGVGRAEFVLEKVADQNWESEKNKNSFWGGRYFVRLEGLDPNYAQVSIYQGDRKIVSEKVEIGKISDQFYLPGLYCQAGLQVAFDGLVMPQDKARIEISSDEGSEVFDVYEGSRFMDNRCSVGDIKIDDGGETGSVRITCDGERVDLEIESKSTGLGEYGVNDSDIKPSNDQLSVKISKLGVRNGEYILKPDGSLVKLNGAELNLVGLNGEINSSNVNQGDREFVLDLWNRMREYKADPQRGAIGIVNNKLEGRVKEYFDSAVENYEKIADEFPNAKESDLEQGKTFGSRALQKGEALAEYVGMDNVRQRLISEYLDKYGEYPDAELYKDELERLYRLDRVNAIASVEFEDRNRNIKLVSLESPKDKGRARFGFDNIDYDIEFGKRIEILKGGVKVGEMVLDDLNTQEARVAVYCLNDEGKLQGSPKNFRLMLDGSGQDFCGVVAKLKNVDITEVAKIRLIPNAKGTETRTNLAINIGIEKRAIKLNPDKAAEKIERLNESIAKWEKVSKQLGSAVSGMKAACFATSGFLTVKNFFTGLSGETLARQEVMNGENGWKNICAKELAAGNYTTLDECYVKNAGQIDKDVALTKNALNEVNARIKELQSKHETASGNFGKSVDSDKVRVDLGNEASDRYGEEVISYTDVDGKKVDKKISEIIDSESVSKGSAVGTDEIRSLMLYSEMKRKGVSGAQAENVDSRLRDIARGVDEDKRLDAEYEKSKREVDSGYAVPIFVSTEGQRDRVADVRVVSDKIKGEINDESITHVSGLVASASATNEGGQSGTSFKSGSYVLGLRESETKKGLYNVQKVWFRDSDGNLEEVEKTPEFLDRYGLGNIRSADKAVDNNKIIESDRRVRYYESEPYKGMPAIVPFDVQRGWYAGTRQTLPVLGGIKPFDSSGRVSSLWVCNVGQNGRIEFETGFGDDLCQQVNLNTGQPLGSFPGKSESEARKLISDAIQAVEEAANKYGAGQKVITINGETLQVGMPATSLPKTQCQDFMSPKDCLLMFNVCDPVVCPSSRCNLGGQYPVPNVVQTGIVGSTLLCLPNAREGIAIPVCLTGIQAGIDGLISIMKSYRDCLQENLDTGKMVGICDQIYSVYLCEFFWNQVAPVVNVLVPKLLETAYGQGVRGGGEYLTVSAAWQNMQNSMNYFTQSYAVNSIQAFRSRGSGISGSRLLESNSIAELGGEFCKVFASTKAPKAFESLIEPDSPTQFHAWFDSKRFSDVSVPATAQYKVFYHIYAGKDQGINFEVYLKDAPESSYYNIAPRVQVASGYIARGEQATETKDFTAPEGYKELCVRINGDEECGFGKVSTSFAVNQLTDSYAQNQIETNQISSEEECIGGKANVGALINPNIQAGAEELINPEDYNRGVVRICSTKNPGLTTDPQRFVSVGNCGDTKISCWLDKKSVDNAISKSNILARNDTLEGLDALTKEYLGERGEFLGEDEARAEIYDLKKAFGDFKNLDKGASEERGLEINGRVDMIYDMIIFEHHKAELLLLKGEVYDKLVRDLYEKKTEISGTSGSGTVPRETTESVPRNNFVIGDIEDGLANLGVNSASTRYYLNGSDVLYLNFTNGYEKIGAVVDSDGLLRISDSRHKDIDGLVVEGWEEYVKKLNKEKGFFGRFFDGVRNLFIQDSSAESVESESAEGNALDVSENPEKKFSEIFVIENITGSANQFIKYKDAEGTLKSTNYYFVTDRSTKILYYMNDNGSGDVPVASFNRDIYGMYNGEEAIIQKVNVNRDEVIVQEIKLRDFEGKKIVFKNGKYSFVD